MLLSGGKGLDQPISYVFMNPKDINNIVMFSITTNILTKPSKSQIVEKCQGLKLPLGSETEKFQVQRPGPRNFTRVEVLGRYYIIIICGRFR